MGSWLLSALLTAGALVGNTAFWVWQINWLYGTRYRGWWVTLVRQIQQAMVVGVPVLYLLAGGTELYSRPAGILPWWAWAYLGCCWVLGLVCVPVQTVRRWLRRPPALLLSNHTVTWDLARELAVPLAGEGRRSWYSRLPGNQVFEVDYCHWQLRLPRLPVCWDGLEILHLSDLHLCGCPARAFYEEALCRVAEPQPDLLVITGDLVDSDRHNQWLVPLLQPLQARLGKFAVLGNHDYEHDVRGTLRELERAGYEVLSGRSVTRLWHGYGLRLVGNEAPWGPAPARWEADEAFCLVLSHSPDNYRWARALGADLVLCGHNHGGQICFPGIGPVLVPSRYSRRYDQGVFFEPPTVMVVNRGLAGTYPLRYNCRPQILRLVLRTAHSQ